MTFLVSFLVGFVICFAGQDTNVYAWEDLMRRGSYDLLRAQDEE